MNRAPKILLAVALLLMVAGIGLAVAQPGSLGDDDEETAAPIVQAPDDEPDDDGTTSTAVTTSSTSTSSTTTDPSTSSTSTTATSAPADTGSTTTVPQTDVEGGQSTPPTGPGSGLGSSGVAEPGDTSDGLAATGGESLILAGLVLGVGGLAARRRSMNSA